VKLTGRFNISLFDEQPTYFSGIAEIKAHNAFFTCSAVVNTFATSGSITATSGHLSYVWQTGLVWLNCSRNDILFPFQLLYVALRWAFFS
jgi:hypothetical protein